MFPMIGLLHSPGQIRSTPSTRRVDTNQPSNRHTESVPFNPQVVAFTSREHILVQCMMNCVHFWRNAPSKITKNSIFRH